MTEYKVTKVQTPNGIWTVGTNGSDEWIKTPEGEEIYRGEAGHSLIAYAMALAERAERRKC